MIAESIFNECVNKLTETANNFAEKIYNLCVAKGLVDHSLESGFTIDPFDYHVDMDNVIVWGDDYDYVAAKGFDVNEISYDGMNIVLFLLIAWCSCAIVLKKCITKKNLNNYGIYFYECYSYSCFDCNIYAAWWQNRLSQR